MSLCPLPTVGPIVGEDGGCSRGELGVSVASASALPDAAGCTEGTSASSFSAGVLVSEGGPDVGGGFSEPVEGLGLASTLLSLPGILLLIDPLKDLADSRVSDRLKDG